MLLGLRFFFHLKCCIMFIPFMIVFFFEIQLLFQFKLRRQCNETLLVFLYSFRLEIQNRASRGRWKDSRSVWSAQLCAHLELSLINNRKENFESLKLRKQIEARLSSSTVEIKIRESDWTRSVRCWRFGWRFAVWMRKILIFIDRLTWNHGKV